MGKRLKIPLETLVFAKIQPQNIPGRVILISVQGVGNAKPKPVKRRGVGLNEFPELCSAFPHRSPRARAPAGFRGTDAGHCKHTPQARIADFYLLVLLQQFSKMGKVGFAVGSAVF
jgi:hypothetical protein